MTELSNRRDDGQHRLKNFSVRRAPRTVRKPFVLRTSSARREKMLEKRNACFKSCPKYYERKLHYVKELKKKIQKTFGR